MGVLFCSQQMQGNVGLVTDYPAVMAGWNIEDITRFHFDYAAIVHGCHRAARNNEANMFDRTRLRACACAQSLANVDRPLPARLVGRAPQSHAANPNDLELALFERAKFVGMLKSLQYDVQQSYSFLAERLQSHDVLQLIRGKVTRQGFKKDVHLASARRRFAQKLSELRVATRWDRG